MTEEINLKHIINCLFKDRNKYKSLSNKDKEKWGFIVNRMLSKKFPEFAQKLNVRSGDFSLVLDLWWVYIRTQDTKGYYFWIWKHMKTSRKRLVDKDTCELVLKRFPFLSLDEIDYLFINHKDIFEEHINYYKKIREDYG